MPQSAPQTLKAGVAGAGVMGRNHARVLAEVQGVDLTTILDPDAVTGQGVADLYGAAAVFAATDTGYGHHNPRVAHHHRARRPATDG